MRRITITMTVPDFVTEGDFYYWDKRDQRYMHVPLQDWVAPMDMRYAEGLEKRIDALEAGLGKVAIEFGRVHESLESISNSTDTAIDAVRDKAIELFGERVAKVEESISWTEKKANVFAKKTEDRLAKLEKPCIDAEAFDKALDIPKVEPVPDITLENRGPYTDILRRLSALEAHFNDSDSEQKKLAEDIKATNGRIQDLEERTGQSRDRLYAY